MTVIDEARDALLRALDSLNDAETILDGEPERVDLVVIYSVGRNARDGEWHDVGGWSSTPGAKWTHAALLRRAADALDDAAEVIDDE